MRGTRLLLFFFVMIIFMASLVSSRKMWGIKKKKGDEEEADSMAETLLNGIAKKPAKKEVKGPTKKNPNVPLFDNLNDI